MSHFKRKHSRRRVKCVICTPVRWQGNGKARRPPKEKALRKILQREATYVD